MNLTPVQQQIVDTPGNLIVRASAGTGKTHTMVAKIATEIEHNHTHKSIALRECIPDPAGYQSAGWQWA